MIVGVALNYEAEIRYQQFPYPVARSPALRHLCCEVQYQPNGTRQEPATRSFSTLNT